MKYTPTPNSNKLDQPQREMNEWLKGFGYGLLAGGLGMAIAFFVWLNL